MPNVLRHVVLYVKMGTEDSSDAINVLIPAFDHLTELAVGYLTSALGTAKQFECAIDYSVDVFRTGHL